MTRWDPTETADYWVVGGRYTDMSFAATSWAASFGPFLTRYDAEACWRSVSFAHTADARVRFRILEGARHVAQAA